MAIRYVDLDADVRVHMIAELDDDIQRGKLYESSRLTSDGAAKWPELLRDAFLRHTDSWLASQLRSRALLVAEEQRRKPKGGFTLARVPVTAPDTLAEGEFNRFYARGLCVVVLAAGGADVEVYRGKNVDDPRRESEAMIGRRLPARKLLEDLRVSQGIEPALGLPRPNSGLSVRRSG